MTEPEPLPVEEDEQPAPAPRRRMSRAQRIGCLILLIPWFALVLSPCFIFLMATQGEIRIGLGGAPEQQFRLWLVMEERQRGFGVSFPTVQEGAEPGEVCVQTNVQYVLWMGSEPPVTYCECYQHPSPDSDWTYTETIQGQCPAR